MILRGLYDIFKVKFNMLKSIFFYVALMTTSITMAQTTTLSFEEYASMIWNEVDVPDGVYIQDTKNILDKFEGTYTGSHKNWRFNIKLTKYVNRKTSRGYFEDFVTFEYTITNTVSGESYTNVGESVYDIAKSVNYADANAIWIVWLDPYKISGREILFYVKPEASRYIMTSALNSEMIIEGEEYKEPIIPSESKVILSKIR